MKARFRCTGAALALAGLVSALLALPSAPAAADAPAVDVQRIELNGFAGGAVARA